MVRRKIQGLEIVVISLDHRPFGDRISEIAKYRDDLVLRADDRVLGAYGTANAGKGNVDSRFGLRGRSGCHHSFDLLLNFRFEFIDSLTDLALGFFRRGLEPQI